MTIRFRKRDDEDDEMRIRGDEGARRLQACDARELRLGALKAVRQADVV